MLNVCYNQSGVDQKELIEFEMTKDLEHLSNSHEIKVYFRCYAVLFETVDPKSNKILLGKISDFFVDLTREEQEIYVNMGKGCVKRAKTKPDLLDFTYELIVCAKQNDNEVKKKKIIKLF